MSRFLNACLAGAIISATAAAPASAAYDPERLTVIVAVIDSLMPHEVGQNTPTLQELKAQGTWFTESRSVFSAETIPNHVAMITGAYPENNGIPTNNYWTREGEPEDVNLSNPEEVEWPTLFTRFNGTCNGDNEVSTAAIMSKKYLWEVMSAGGMNDQADVHFNPTAHPTYMGDKAGLVPDRTTMQEVIDNLGEANFFFVNLGQVDRSGHVDQIGPTGVPAARQGGLVETDLEFSNLKRELGERWNSTVLIVLSDHGMDWSTPESYITLGDVVDGNSLFVVENGGTDNIYVKDRDSEGDWQAALTALDTVKAINGVKNAWFTSLHPGWTEGLSDEQIESMLLPAHFHSRHENLGDLVAMAEPGYHFVESEEAHAIRGNHGHKITLHNTFMITGGADFIQRGQVIAPENAPDSEHDHYLRIENQSENVDVAPTVAWLFGIPLFDRVPKGNSAVSSERGQQQRNENSFELVPRFDGRAIAEAFTIEQPPEGSCGKL